MQWSGLRRCASSRQPDRPFEQVLAALGVLLAMLVVVGSNDDARAASDAVMRDSFEGFAVSWMQGMAREADRERARARFVQPTSSAPGVEMRHLTYGDDVDLRLKSTGNSAAPFVGVLTYTEHTWVCRGGPEGPSCVIVESSPVTEIFPYRNGAWRY